MLSRSQLTFEEFCRAVPERISQGSSKQQICDIFNSVDADRSGTISMDEYFLFALGIAAQQTGSGIEAIFRRYDKGGEGTLDAAEFSRAVEVDVGRISHLVSPRVSSPLPVHFLLCCW